jgi:hypothetical protein
LPQPDNLEYNPNIIGFVSDIGPVTISLHAARKRYGELPSEYKLVSARDGRLKKKGLNLALGRMVTETLKRKENVLNKSIFDFYNAWHRDYRKEFNINIHPFDNLNDPVYLGHVLKKNKENLIDASNLKLRPYLEKNNLIRKDILNSINNTDLPDKSERIIERKLKSLTQGGKVELARKSMNIIRASRILNELKGRTNLDVIEIDQSVVRMFTDEIAREVIKLSEYISLSEDGKIIGVRGIGVEFEFAPRDISYLLLGKKTGDCTSDKSPFQADSDVENIYWTVFPWILDRNYQIMKVFYDGEFIMKVHLLPLFLMHNGVGEIVLAVDAIETVRAFRDDLEEHKRDTLLEKKEAIFSRVMEEIEQLGDRMGIQRIYAEKFSNTKWVREQYESYNEIFLHVDSFVKIDELEDVYCLSLELSRSMQLHPPGDIFMEIQMKNTSLQPLVTHRTTGVKPYAVIRGNPDDGIPLKKVIGV